MRLFKNYFFFFFLTRLRSKSYLKALNPILWAEKCKNYSSACSNKIRKKLWLRNLFPYSVVTIQLREGLLPVRSVCCLHSGFGLKYTATMETF